MAVENQNALNYTLIALSAIVGYIAYLFFGYVLDINTVQVLVMDRMGETGARMIPIVLALAVAGGTYFQTKKSEAATKFGGEAITELKKVVWPTRKEVTGTTTAVLIVTFVVAIILFIFDKLFGWFISILVG